MAVREGDLEGRVGVRGPDPVRIPMSDGVELGGDLYLPEGRPPFPALVRKTPYDRRARTDPDLYLASCGFAVLVVNQRGRFDSGGTFYQMRNESVDHNDGFDTIEWAAAAPWSTGRVGTYGISSDGQWQIAAATARPPSLVAMFVSYAADARLARIEGGAYLGTSPAWAAMNGLSRRLANSEDWRAWLADWRRTRLPLLASFMDPEFVDAFVHVDYDAYWRETDPSNLLDRVDVPVLHEGGWYDRYVGSTFRNFARIRATAEREEVSSAQRVVMGPWTHGGGIPADAGPARFGPGARIDRLGLHRRWFDHWLRGDGRVDDLPPVRLYLVGADTWIDAPTWPLPDARPMRLHLRSGPSGAADSVNDGRLMEDEPGPGEPPDAFVHDPYDPIPSIGGHGGVGWQWPAGPLDQRPAERASLTYTSEPLPEDLTVVGEPVVRFHAASSAVDTDFVLTLSDVHREGHSAILRQNALRAMYREGEDRAVPLAPGRAYEFSAALAGVGAVFRRGHRIRLRIASTSFPAFLPNPGTGEPLAFATHAVTATNSIFHDAHRPSVLELPVLPTG